MRRKPIVSAGLAAALVLGIGAGPAWAYFTDSTAASGAVPISVEPSTDMIETFDSAGKHVVIRNDAASEMPVFVRAKVFTSLDWKAEGTGWTQSGDWFVYDDVVEPGEAAKELGVSMEFPRATDEGGIASEGDEYNVVVVYESTPVLYDAQGNPYADWSIQLDRGMVEGRS